TATNRVLFQINDTPITLASVFMFFAVLLAFVLVSRIVDRFILRRLLARLEVEIGLQYTMRRVTRYLVVILGTVIAFQFIGIDLSGLAMIFGLLSVGIGFGLQNVTSNFVAGLILLFERPIMIGDRITVGNTEGDVVSINMRSTTVRSVNNITIIIPNSEFISNHVINWSHGDPRIRVDIEVGVSYGSNLDNVLTALKEVAREHPEVLQNPVPDVLLKSFGDSSWDMVLRAWIDDPQRHHIIRSEINCAIVAKFRERGIEIPFPQRDLHVRSPLPVPIARDDA
ncbi:MAG TPA: mechanosensitive ion channel domain-containing protein, partial [candidate division Zixibacteria bacterium]|nr:mechanosensitive ion channel domain-containing protein [candidate division Zixibacteria bacterium]